jgi:hypothetical protein
VATSKRTLSGPAGQATLTVEDPATGQDLAKSLPLTRGDTKSASPKGPGQDTQIGDCVGI